MLSMPLVAAAQTPSSTDYSVIGTVVLTQFVTLALFFLKDHLDRRNDRDKRARDMKRDVFLEVAPAIQRVYASLAEMASPLTSVEKIAEKLTGAFGAVAKLQAVANDETLEAARKLMTSLGSIMLRMMAKRAEVGTDLEATKQLIAFWRQETEGYPALIADFASKARSEIPLPLDKNAFLDGIELSNKAMFAEMDNLFESFAKQQSGESRESQAGRVTEDREQSTRDRLATNGGVDSICMEAQLTPDQVANISAEIVGLRQQVAFWEYRYLNYFLVHRTHLVLNWLVDRQARGQSTTQHYYEAELSARLVSPGESKAVLQALEAHALISAGGVLFVTAKGLDYVSWRGPIPQTDAAG